MPTSHEKRHLRPRATARGWMGRDCASAWRVGARDSKGQPDLRKRRSVCGNPPFGRGCRGANALTAYPTGARFLTVGWAGIPQGAGTPLWSGSTGGTLLAGRGKQRGRAERSHPLPSVLVMPGSGVRSTSDAVLQTHGLPLTQNRLYVVGRRGRGLPLIARGASTDLTPERRSWQGCGACTRS